MTCEMRDPLPLDADLITQRLQTQRFGRPLSVYDRVGSTNDIARVLAEQGVPEGTAILAKEQTGGRGRLGRKWASPPGGLWLSVVLRPRLSLATWSLLGCATSVAAASAVETLTGVPVGLKWPNDLVVEQRKLGGVLIESGATYAIAGIGINANIAIQRLEPAVRAVATSLVELLGRHVDLVALTQEVLLELERHYDLLQQEDPVVMQRWRDRSVTLGRRVHVVGAEVFDGVAESIDREGALLVRTTAGVRRVLAGTVSLREAEPLPG